MTQAAQKLEPPRRQDAKDRVGAEKKLSTHAVLNVLASWRLGGWTSIVLLLAVMLISGSIASPLLALEGVPKVALSEQHRAMCKVGVGDVLPKLTLRTPNGDEQELAPLFGKTGAVVVFYQGAAKQRDAWMTSMLLADLEPDVARRFGKKGVATIAIQIGGAAEVTDGLITLSDPDGEAFARVGEGKLPRVYLVDAVGKILWFDIEYSNSTRRELRQSLASIAGMPAVAKRGE